MRTELIRDLLKYLDGNGALESGDCPDDVNRAIEEMPLPTSLKRLLQWYWPNRSCRIGRYNIYTAKECLADKDLAILMQANMLPIGYAINGDPLVVRFSDDKCAVGLISHDKFWEEHTDPEVSYAEVTGSIEELLWRAADGRYLPTDFYAASELSGMRKEIGLDSKERR